MLDADWLHQMCLAAGADDVGFASVDNPALTYYPPAAQPQYQAPFPPQYQPPAPSGGGGLQRFLSGRFGQAIVTGAGIGIGDDIVNSIFDRL